MIRFKSIMIKKLTYKLLTLIAALAIAPAAKAAMIAATDFDAALPNPRTSDTLGVDMLTNIVWTGDDLVNVSPGNSASYAVLDGDAGSTTRGFHAGTWGNQGFAPDVNVQNYADWAATFTFDLLNSYTGTLSGVSFDYQGLTNSGDLQGSGRLIDMNVTVNGTAFGGTLTTSDVLGAGSLSFTGSEALTSGTNTIKISTDFYANTAGWNLGIDNLQFDGTLTAIPESSTSVILIGGLGFLLLLRRGS